MKNQTIIGCAGRKQAGKGTSYTLIKLWRPDAVEFSFATPLKTMAVDILGLEHWQAFGNDEQKRTLCPHLLWENFPIPAFEDCYGRVILGFVHYKVHALEEGGYLREYDNDLKEKRGPMSAREVLQYYGTEIFRKQYANVWADALVRSVRKSGCDLAVVTDVRFPNEVEAIQKAGGKVVKLTRRPFPEDNHPSEVSLDEGNFEQNRFDAILDNENLDIPAHSEELYALMRRWGIVNSKSVNRMHL